MTYNEEDIKPLDPRKHIRLRPKMYIGGNDIRALHNMVNEVVGYAVEEVLADRGDHIWIELRPDNEISIRDNSVGLSIEPDKYLGVTRMESYLEFVEISRSRLEPTVYKFPRGLYGIGLSVVNILSSEMSVKNCRDGEVWTKRYKEGIPVAPLERLDNGIDPQSGVTIKFKPDFTIFDQNDFDLQQIETRAQKLAYLIPKLTIEVKDNRLDPSYEVSFHYPDGVKTWVENINAPYRALHEVIHIQDQVVITPQRDGIDPYTIMINLAFQFCEADQTDIRSYINTIETPEGGTHAAAFKAVLWSYFNNYLKYPRFASGRPPEISWDEIARGLTAVISVWHPDPAFVSAMRVELLNPDVYGAVAGCVYSHLHSSWNQQQVFENIVEYYLSRRQNG